MVFPTCHLLVSALIQVLGDLHAVSSLGVLGSKHDEVDGRDKVFFWDTIIFGESKGKSTRKMRCEIQTFHIVLELKVSCIVQLGHGTLLFRYATTVPPCYDVILSSWAERMTTEEPLQTEQSEELFWLWPHGLITFYCKVWPSTLQKFQGCTLNFVLRVSLNQGW